MSSSWVTAFTQLGLGRCEPHLRRLIGWRASGGHRHGRMGQCMPPCIPTAELALLHACSHWQVAWHLPAAIVCKSYTSSVLQVGGVYANVAIVQSFASPAVPRSISFDLASLLPSLHKLKSFVCQMRLPMYVLSAVHWSTSRTSWLTVKGQIRRGKAYLSCPRPHPHGACNRGSATIV